MAAMKFAALRLAIAVLLFAGWISWLIYLTLTSANPTVLSRPQLLVSTLEVVAQVPGITAEPPEVSVERVYWPTEQQNQWQGKKIIVNNLSECQGWSGPGEYLMPLSSEGQSFRVTPIPPSPGYSRNGPPVIYAWTPQVARQLDTIAHPAR
jgi:hypothetical protein